ncbi:hypothetical protein M885DRAFT_515772 [Pelagophyceae sp. CCMP2097]|nr:hypothetical protein M885DRAFT_515772 [Pelagophyceae sp. CCMP2097]
MGRPVGFAALWGTRMALWRIFALCLCAASAPFAHASGFPPPPQRGRPAHDRGENRPAHRPAAPRPAPAFAQSSVQPATAVQSGPSAAQVEAAAISAAGAEVRRALPRFRVATTGSVSLIFALLTWRHGSKALEATQSPYRTLLHCTNLAAAGLALHGARRHKIVLKTILLIDLAVEGLSLAQMAYKLLANNKPVELHNLLAAVWFGALALTCVRARWIAPPLQHVYQHTLPAPAAPPAFAPQADGAPGGEGGPAA